MNNASTPMIALLFLLSGCSSVVLVEADEVRPNLPEDPTSEASVEEEPALDASLPDTSNMSCAGDDCVNPSAKKSDRCCKKLKLGDHCGDDGLGDCREDGFKGPLVCMYACGSKGPISCVVKYAKDHKCKNPCPGAPCQ